jgi:Zn finger protein HypA/HybF involved in hydrogenase expression
MEINAKLKIDCKDNKCYCCDFKHVQRLSDTEVDVWCPFCFDSETQINGELIWQQV